MTVAAIERGLSPDSDAPEGMPKGIAFSAILHLGTLVLIAVGLPVLFHRAPLEDMPIAVQLVTIAPDTRATHPNPFKPKAEAKPDAAVAPPAPKPLPKPEPPKPAAEPPPSAAAPPPAPQPEPAKAEPQAPPPPPPPPKPVAAQTPPPPPPEPKPKPEPHQRLAAAKPEPAKASPAAFDALMQSLDAKPDKKPDPAAFDSLLKNLTREQTVESDNAPPQPHRQAAAAAASSQPKAPLGSQLTASEIDALRSMIMQQLVPCWNVPAGARDAKDLSIEIRASVNRDGTVVRAAIVDQGRMGDPLYRAAAESARRTFFNPQCTPLKLPPDKYDVWKDLDVNFDPKELL